jgi:hypothetical protein
MRDAALCAASLFWVCRDLYGFSTTYSIYTLLKHDFKQQAVNLIFEANHLVSEYTKLR